MTTALLAIKPPYTMRERWLAAYRDWRRGRRDLEPGQTPAQLALMTIQRIGRIGAIPTDVMDVRVRTPIGRKPAWWQVAGKTCVAAYQPKGAASLAASYVNLANPGTYDAAPGVAPTWASGTGWTFDGSGYLETSVVPTVNYCMIVSFGNSSAWTASVAGCGVQGTNKNFAINPRYGSSQHSWTFGFNADSVAASNVLTGVAALCGGANPKGYLNGTLETSLPSSTIDSGIPSIQIGRRNHDVNTRGFTGNVKALAIYSATLTAGEVAAVSAAMAAL